MEAIKIKNNYTIRLPGHVLEQLQITPETEVVFSEGSHYSIVCLKEGEILS